MSLGDLVLQEYSSGFYHTVTPSPDPNIGLIQLSLDISDSPFDLSEILTLELLLYSIGDPMNITITYDPGRIQKSMMRNVF